jgi:amidophosphoribosyltransferase
VQSGRDLNVLIKFNPVKGVIKGKNIVLVDDSIVRGTTMKKLVNLIKTAEPASIHLRISSPPIICPCFYGIDMPTKEELIASAKNVEDIRKYLGVDSLGYLSIDTMLSVLKPEDRPNFCTACFSGSYFVVPTN